jgi:hypothetical protein
MLTDRRRGLRTLAWTLGLGLAGAAALAVWAGPGNLVREIIRFHALKMPMSPRSLASRIVGKAYPDWTYLLWHESLTLEAADEVVRSIVARVSPEGAIFGDASTVPLFALLSQRRIAANEIDTNLQRYRSGFTDPAALIRKIDLPTTELIIIWDGHGVATLPELKRLLEAKSRRSVLPGIRAECGVSSCGVRGSMVRHSPRMRSLLPRLEDVKAAYVRVPK